MSAPAGLLQTIEPSQHPSASKYLVLRTARPKWMSLQLTTDLASLLGYHSADLRSLQAAARSVAFLARGPGVCRIVATYSGAHLLADEIALDRFIAVARVSDKQIFHLPRAVARHLGLGLRSRGTNKNRTSDDILLWIVKSSEYFESPLPVGGDLTRAGKAGAAHVYLTRSRIPLLLELEGLEVPEEHRPR